MKLKVDNNKCLKCGMCHANFPDVFEFNDNGDIEVKNENIIEENKEEIEEFKNVCPGVAIEEVKEEKDTNE